MNSPVRSNRSDFFKMQSDARLHSWQMVFGFCLVIFLTAAAPYALLYFHVPFRLALHPLFPQIKFAGNSFLTREFIFILACFSGLILFNSLYSYYRLRAGGKAMALRLHARQIAQETTDTLERRLIHVVEEMAVASRMPVPSLYLLDAPEINAFTAGLTPEDAIIAVTTGALQLLSRDELQALIAHEFSHILNGDMRLNFKMVSLLDGVESIAQAGRSLLRVRSGRQKGIAGTLLVGFALYVIGSIGLWAGRFIKSAHSRQREFLADAAALQFTRNPEAITGVFKKIGGLFSEAEYLGRASVADVDCSHLYFYSTFSSKILGKIQSLFATHPSLVDRIRAIEPSFNGQFPKIALSLKPVVNKKADEVESDEQHMKQIIPQLFGMIATAVSNPYVELIAAARSSYDSRALVLSLLLASEGSPVFQKQIQALGLRGSQVLSGEVLSQFTKIKNLTLLQKLRLFNFALPALRSLSPKQSTELLGWVDVLVSADGEVSWFEFACFKLLQRRLERPVQSQYVSKVSAPIAKQVQLYFSTIAYLDSISHTEALKAYTAAAQCFSLDLVTFDLLPSRGFTMNDFSECLGVLCNLNRELKIKLIEATRRCAESNEKISESEHVLIELAVDLFAL